MPKEYKVWVCIEEHDTETDEHRNMCMHGVEDLSIGEGAGVRWQNLEVAIAVQGAVKIAGEIALMLPQIIIEKEDDHLTGSFEVQGQQVKTVYIPMEEAFMPIMKEMRNESEEVGRGVHDGGEAQNDGQGGD